MILKWSSQTMWNMLDPMGECWTLVMIQHQDKLFLIPGARVVSDKGVLPCNSWLTVPNYMLTGAQRLGFVLSESFTTSCLIYTTRTHLWSLVQSSRGQTNHGTLICSCSHCFTILWLCNMKGSLSMMLLWPPLFNHYWWLSVKKKVR